MPTRSEDLTFNAVYHVQVAMPTDATADSLDLRQFAPYGGGASKWVRWLGSDAAVLWYVPTTVRTAFTTSETSAPAPNARGAIPANFLAGEERPLQALAIDTDSTAGSWEIVF
jgi:hypothetical protein